MKGGRDTLGMGAGADLWGRTVRSDCREGRRRGMRQSVVRFGIGVGLQVSGILFCLSLLFF